MKQHIFPLILVILACIAGCKSRPARHLAPGDTATSAQQVADTPIIPAQIGYVNDFFRLFTNAQINSLDSLVRDYERKTTNEIAIVTLTSDTTLVNHQNFDKYTLQMANTWSVGKKEKNNGILIAIAPALRRIRIQNGLGIEKIISNEETKAILDSIFTPHFKKGAYFEGTRQGILAIIKKLQS